MERYGKENERGRENDRKNAKDREADRPRYSEHKENDIKQLPIPTHTRIAQKNIK